MQPEEQQYQPPPQPEPGQVARTPSEPQLPITSSRRPRFSLAMLSLLVLLIIVGLGLYLGFHNKSSKTPTSTTTTPSASANIAPTAVNITSGAFVPANIQIKVGQAVVWTNTDTKPHSVVIDSLSAQSGNTSDQNLSQNGTFSYIFDKAGTYAYHDGTNPYGVTGTVIVK